MQEAIDALTIAVWSDPANAEAKQLLDKAIADIAR